MSRFLINARAAARARTGGVERWTRELAARLPDLRPGAYRVVAPPRPLAHRAGHAWEQIALPAWAALTRAELVLSPANLAPLAWPRNVVVLHDLAALEHPEWYSRAFVAAQRRLVPRVARGARAIVTPSRFSRRELVDGLGVGEDRVAVVPGGVSDAFSPEADSERARAALGLERPYVLTVGPDHARKNRSALAAAARRLAAHGIELVAAGGPHRHMRAEPAVDGVRELGYVSEELLPGVYAGSRAFVLSSWHEGFGLPCLEAMGCGSPVVAADRGALPETCAGAALLVEPGDPEAVATEVERAACDESVRSRLIAAGLARAAELTWARTAREVDALLARLSPRD